jgi:hypothetical protein
MSGFNQSLRSDKMWKFGGQRSFRRLSNVTTSRNQISYECSAKKLSPDGVKKRNRTNVGPGKLMPQASFSSQNEASRRNARCGLRFFVLPGANASSEASIQC